MQGIRDIGAVRGIGGIGGAGGIGGVRGTMGSTAPKISKEPISEQIFDVLFQ